METEIIELTGIPGQLVEQGLGEVTLGELVPVEGATAEIILAYLPSCAVPWETLNFHLDFRNTSSEPVSIRPVIYFIREPEAPFRGWGTGDGVILQPGESYEEKYGRYWLGGITAYGTLVIQRVEAAIEVYTPEGWVEADRVAGEPFEWWDTLPLPIVTVEVPEYADPGQPVNYLISIYNPGYTNHPSSWCTYDGGRSPPAGWWWHPPNTFLRVSPAFTMGEKDVTIKVTPYRLAAPGLTEYAGKPVSFTVRTTAVIPRYTLTVTIDGDGTVDPAGGEFEEGAVVELTAYPAPGWWFHSWEGTDNNAANPTTVTMDRDRHVVCNFTQEAPAGCLPVVAAGAVLLAGIIALIILLV